MIGSREGNAGARRDENRARQVNRVLYFTLALNVAVAAAKILYGHRADALAIRADGFHSLTDSLNNVIALVGIWIAGRPPDKEHPYGHHKFEIFAAGVIGISLLLMSWDVASEAFARFQGDVRHLPHIGPAAFVILGGTLAVNLGVSWWEEREGRRLYSAVLQSDARHTRSDCFVTAGVILAMAAVHFGYAGVDLLAAGVVAILIAWAGVSVVRSNVAYLADTALVDESKVLSIVLDTPGVASCHKIRTRGTPSAIYMDLHIQIAPHLKVVDAHQVTHAVIDGLRAAFPALADATIHTEPAHPHQRYKPFPNEIEEEAR